MPTAQADTVPVVAGGKDTPVRSFLQRVIQIPPSAFFLHLLALNEERPDGTLFHYSV